MLYCIEWSILARLKVYKIFLFLYFHMIFFYSEWRTKALSALSNQQFIVNVVYVRIYIHTHTQRSRSFLDWFDCESSWSSIDPTIETQLKSRNTGWYTSTIYSWSNTWCCEPAIRLSKSIWDLEKNESNATICYRTISNQIFKWQYIDVYDGRVAWGAKSIERSLEKHRMYRYTCTRIKLNM